MNMSSRKTNYSAVEIHKLLDIIESRRPLGGKAWTIVTNEYNLWTMANSFPSREVKPLKAKYTRLCSTDPSVLEYSNVRARQRRAFLFLGRPPRIPDLGFTKDIHSGSKKSMSLSNAATSKLKTSM